MELTKQQIEDESRRGRIAGIATLAGVALFVVAMVAFASDFSAAEEAERLQMFDSIKGELLPQLLLQALAILLFIPSLVSLFRSIRDRSEALRPGLIGLVVVSPVLLALSLVTTYFAYKEGADEFLAKGGPLDTLFDDVEFTGDLTQADNLDAGIKSFTDAINGLNDAADDAFLDQFPTQLRTGFGLAGSLGLAFTTVYMALHAMRAGLMTRFWGTLAMALGVGTLLFGSLMLVAYMIVIALLVAGWWPGTRPPAWDAGKAMPWPTPGRPAPAEPKEEELAAPEDFEGTATEVEPEPQPNGEGGPQKRKRKRRD